jgi:DNA polymerase IV
VHGVRWVLHLDMDAFYASVEQLTRPTLHERPVLVGGLGPRGAVAAASYQARRYGARSAMPMAQARRLCPAAVVLPPRFELYHVVSERVFDVLRGLAPLVEQISLDEAFVEPPSLVAASPAMVEAGCERLRADVRAATGLPCSVGAGSGKQLAKIASELAKPDGYRVLPHGTEASLLAPLPVRWLWGVGPVAEARLRRVGVTTIGELAAMDVRDTVELLGEAVGASLHRLAHGVDERPVAPRTDARSVSAESTFDLDVSDLATIDAAVTAMATSAHRRLVAGDHATRTVTVKVRGADFSEVSRSESLPAATTDLPTLVGIARRLVRIALPPTAVRLIGVAYTGLGGQAQEALFSLDSLVGLVGLDGAELDAVPAPGTVAQPMPGAAATSAASAQSTARPEPGFPRPTPSSQSPTTPRSQLPEPAADGPAAGEGHRANRAPVRAYPTWRPGDDVSHVEHGHGWVQGAGHGRVTVRFETRHTGPGRAVTVDANDPALTHADALTSLDG